MLGNIIHGQYMESFLDPGKRTLQWVGYELFSWLEKYRLSPFLVEARKKKHETLINKDEGGKEVFLAQV